MSTRDCAINSEARRIAFFESATNLHERSISSLSRRSWVRECLGCLRARMGFMSKGVAQLYTSQAATPAFCSSNPLLASFKKRAWRKFPKEFCRVLYGRVDGG